MNKLLITTLAIMLATVARAQELSTNSSNISCWVSGKGSFFGNDCFRELAAADRLRAEEAKRAADCKAADEALDKAMAIMSASQLAPDSENARQYRANAFESFRAALADRLRLNCAQP